MQEGSPTRSIFARKYETYTSTTLEAARASCPQTNSNSRCLWKTRCGSRTKVANRSNSRSLSARDAPLRQMRRLRVRSSNVRHVSSGSRSTSCAPTGAAKVRSWLCTTQERPVHLGCDYELALRFCGEALDKVAVRSSPHREDVAGFGINRERVHSARDIDLTDDPRRTLRICFDKRNFAAPRAR